MTLITCYTNKKLKSLEKTEELEINARQIKANIGILLLFGVTRKRNVSIEELWNSKSIHYSNWAATTMP